MGIPITVSGFLGGAPERRTTAKDTPYARLRLGSADRVRTESGEWVDGDTNWFDVEAWGRLGDHALASLGKGSRVVVQGDLAVREWTGQDGARRTTVRIRAAAIGPDLRFGAATVARAARPAAPPAVREPEGPAEDGADGGDAWAPARQPGSGAPREAELVPAGSYDDVPF